MEQQDYDDKAKRVDEVIQEMAPEYRLGVIALALKELYTQGFGQGYRVGFAEAGEAIAKELKEF